jgi:hypothetical protein
MATHYSRNIKTLFKKSKSVKSIKHIDVWEELHGEQREWWDRQHLFPKELSVYQHGALVRSTKWYLNGQLESSIAVIGRIRRDIGFYSSGMQKYKKSYVLLNKQWLRHGIWYGYYRNGFKHYAEKYNLNSVVSTIRFFSNGNVITKFSLEKSSSESSESESSIESVESQESEDGSIELTEKIFEETNKLDDSHFSYRLNKDENDCYIRLPYKNI